VVTPPKKKKWTGKTPFVIEAKPTFWLVKFQDLFDVKFDGALGCVLLHTKRFGNKDWKEFEPPVLQKEEQKSADV
jgi:hypothetical protein